MRTVAEYRGRYAGRRFVIVGKGPTRFKYANLRNISSPIIFLNDAVQFERYAVAASETFFFAHDPCQAVWLRPALRSIAILPKDGALASDGKRRLLNAVDVEDRLAAVRHAVYKWWPDWRKRRSSAEHLTKPEVVDAGRLYYASGTIHSAIHFAWLCGAQSIIFIGCDGFERPGRTYDDRIKLHSSGKPLHVFGRIRSQQDWLCDALGLKTEYVNEPRLDPVIPRRAHFVWLGHRVPDWVDDNVRLFRGLHPGWEVELWRRPPDDMPPDLLRAMADAEQICTKKDVLSYWLLWSRGGLFIDADIVPLRSFEPLRRYEAFAGREHNGRVNCAVMGSIKHGSAVTRILSEVRAIATTGDTHRTRFGPRMLTAMWGSSGDGDLHLATLPQHYFYLLVGQKEAHPWWAMDAAGRAVVFQSHASRLTDPTAPYAIHLWGVDASSQRKALGRADALAYRVLANRNGDRPLRGAEVGVLAGKMTRPLLAALPDLTLYLVDDWAAGETSQASPGGRQGGEADYRLALKQTEFAADRRIVLRGDSVEMAGRIEDGALDFAFIDGDHRYEGVKRDIAAWLPKVRPGGLISGHDIDNPIDEGWGVRRAVTEVFSEDQIELGAEYTWFVRKESDER